MILLDTSTKLEVVLASALSATEPEFQVSFIDTDTNTAGHNDGVTSGDTGVTLAAAPSSGTRLIRQFSIYNAKTVDVQATVKIDDGSWERRLITANIPPAGTLFYNSETGFEIWSGNASGSSLTAMKEISFEAEYDNGTVTSDTTIDWSNGNNQVITLSADITLSFSNIGVGHKQLRVVQDATGGRTPTLPSGLWPGGSAGSFSTAASAVDILSIYYDGSSYYYQLTKGWA